MVLVIDEAGMVDARQLARILDHAATHGAKVILLGDPDQLKPIGPGDAYRGLLEQHTPARLETIRRQAEPWQREASEHLAGGRVAPALDAYHQAGRLHVADTREAARTELLRQYAADRAADPARGQLVLAYRNDDVARLNTGIRDQRLAAGELRGNVTVAGADYAAGDRLVFLKNDHQGREVTNLGRVDERGQGVKNGTLATLESVAPDRFVARLDDGRRVAFSPAEYDHIAHGYAVTIHKSQGATVDRTYVLADPMMNRNASNVAFTRHPRRPLPRARRLGAGGDDIGVPLVVDVELLDDARRDSGHVVADRKGDALAAGREQQLHVIAEMAGQDLLEVGFGDAQRQLHPLDGGHATPRVHVADEDAHPAVAPVLPRYEGELAEGHPDLDRHQHAPVLGGRRRSELERRGERVVGVAVNQRRLDLALQAFGGRTVAVALPIAGPQSRALQLDLELVGFAVTRLGRCKPERVAAAELRGDLLEVAGEVVAIECRAPTRLACQAGQRILTVGIDHAAPLERNQ